MNVTHMIPRSPTDAPISLSFRANEQVGISCFIFFLLLPFFAARPTRAQQSVCYTPAEIIVVHAKIYTVDEKKPWPDSLAILKGKIVAIGKEEEVTRRRGIGTKMTDAGGKLSRNAAFAGRLDKYQGSLEVGKAADLIMLDRNIFEIDPHNISKTRVVLTIVGGNIVYEEPH